MAKAASVVFVDTESHADHGLVFNALGAAREFAETDDDEVGLLFDGAGTQ